MSEIAESITVKIEREEEDLLEINNFDEFEKKCDWCGKEIDDFECFGNFCAESCFNSSRRAQFKMSKFGIEIEKKSFTPSDDRKADKIQKRFKSQQKQFFRKFRERKRPRKIIHRQAEASRTFTKLPLPKAHLIIPSLQKPDKPICEDKPVCQNVKVPLPTLISGVRFIPVPIPYPVFIPVPILKTTENNEENSDFEKEVLNALHLSLKSGN